MEKIYSGEICVVASGQPQCTNLNPMQGLHRPVAQQLHIYDYKNTPCCIYIITPVETVAQNRACCTYIITPQKTKIMSMLHIYYYQEKKLNMLHILHYNRTEHVAHILSFAHSSSQLASDTSVKNMSKTCQSNTSVKNLLIF